MDRVLLTGANGGIGKRLRTLLRGVYKELRLSDHKKPGKLGKGEKFVIADLADFDAVERAVAGMDGIIHMGAVSREQAWDEILPANIVGTYNLFEAARRRRVQRVVFASTNHTVGFYPRTRRLAPDVTLRPDGYYGVSKAFGEAIGALYAYKHGLSVTCLRIGHVLETPNDLRDLSIWLKPEDLAQLIRIGLEHPEIRFEVLWGSSDNARGWWDNGRAAALGYRPAGRAEDHSKKAMAAEAKQKRPPAYDHYQGGEFAADGHDDPRQLALW